MAAMPSKRAFTLVEILITMSIVVVLLGLLVPALNAVRESARRTTAAERVATIDIALGVYRQEDPQRRFPPVEADGSLRTATPPHALDLLAMVGLTWTGQELAADPVMAGALVDPWRQPYRYHCDAVVDGAVGRPAELADWNPRGGEPWAYVWSSGPPSAGMVNDAAHANAWIYRRTTP